MQLSPAVHIAIFGVYPDRTVEPDLLESLTGSHADTQSTEVVREGRLGSAQVARMLRGQMNEQDLLDFQHFEATRNEHTRIRNAAELRMRGGYEMAARAGWIKPVSGMIYLADPIPVRSDVNLAEAIERACTESFYQFVCRESLPVYHVDLSDEYTADNALTGVAYIRCVINGELQKPVSTAPQYDLFKSLSPSFMEPALNPALFDLSVIDTLAYMQAQPALRHSRFLGYGTGPSPGPGRHFS